MRRASWLRGNKTAEQPHLAIWVDTETKPRQVDPKTQTHHLWFGWAAVQRTSPNNPWTEPEWFRFETPVAFWSWVDAHLRPKTRCLIFAHNLGFDAPVLGAFTLLPERGWTLKRAIIESPPVICTWRRGDRTITLLDTLNWWRLPLKTLGESVGVAKQPMPNPDGSPESWDAYCKADVEVIRQALHTWWTFLKRLDLGGFAHTLAGQSFRAYRHRFLDHPVLLDDNPLALDVARNSYFGGRVECYRLGRIEGPIHHYDVNSMYPYVMRAYEFPSVLRLTAVRGTIPELERWVKDHAVVAEVLLETPIPRYAHRLRHRLVFPVGRFPATLTTPDLAFALSHGHIREVRRTAVYDRAPLFARYVENLYAERQAAQAAGHPVQSWLLKILLNSLYGKFGQSGQVWNKVGVTTDPGVRQWIEFDVATGERTTKRQFAHQVQERRHDPEAPLSHPAIAAHVTAYARAYLWDLQERVGRDRVLYCDTDSLFLTGEPLGPGLGLPDPTGLGGLKHEGSYPWLILRGAKDYETPSAMVVKGVRSRAIWTGPNSVEQEEWSNLRGMVSRGALDAPRTTVRSKVLSRAYEKGEVTPDGRVLPWHLSDAWPGHGSGRGSG